MGSRVPSSEHLHQSADRITGHSGLVHCGAVCMPWRSVMLANLQQLPHKLPPSPFLASLMNTLFHCYCITVTMRKPQEVIVSTVGLETGPFGRWVQVTVKIDSLQI